MKDIKPQFYCENCGAKVARRDERCPHCGRYFTNVRCPSCGFTGPQESFVHGCPECGHRYMAPHTHRESTPLPLWVYGVTIVAFLVVCLALYYFTR